METVTVEGLGARIKRALSYLASQIGDVDRAEVGRRVGQARRGGAPYTVQAITEWIGGRSDISVRVAYALARECGVRPAWLCFNDGPMPDPSARLEPMKKPPAVKAAAATAAMGESIGRGGPARVMKPGRRDGGEATPPARKRRGG
jgi:hypothetical protein